MELNTEVKLYVYGSFSSTHQANYNKFTVL